MNSIQKVKHKERKMVMIREITIGFLILLIIGSLCKILFNYNISINIIHWSINSIQTNFYILIGSLLLIGLIFIPKYKNK
jgi:hypothetical protein